MLTNEAVFETLSAGEQQAVREAQATAASKPGLNPDRQGGDTRAQINRANSAHSSGPRTAAGKAASKFNARRHNLTGQTLIMEHTDLANYFASSARMKADLQPQGEFEITLVQSITDAQWQLDRARAIETNLLFEAASKHTGEDWATAQTKAFLEHAKQLDLLSRYATRYHRQVLQLHDRLWKIQKERRNEEHHRSQERKRRHNEAFASYQQAAATGQAASNQSDTKANGFVSQPLSGLKPDRQGGDQRAQSAPETTQIASKKAA